MAAYLTYSALDQWLPWHPRQAVTSDAITITYHTTPTLVFAEHIAPIDSRITLEIRQYLQHDATGAFHAINEPTLCIEPATEQSMQWFWDIGKRLEHLFCLLVGTPNL